MERYYTLIHKKTKKISMIRIKIFENNGYGENKKYDAIIKFIKYDNFYNKKNIELFAINCYCKKRQTIIYDRFINFRTELLLYQLNNNLDIIKKILPFMKKIINVFICYKYPNYFYMIEILDKNKNIKKIELNDLYTLFKINLDIKNLNINIYENTSYYDLEEHNKEVLHEELILEVQKYIFSPKNVNSYIEQYGMEDFEKVMEEHYN
jgi:hypothetical protein